MDREVDPSSVETAVYTSVRESSDPRSIVPCDFIPDEGRFVSGTLWAAAIGLSACSGSAAWARCIVPRISPSASPSR